jgi:hypothetical protein
MFLPQFPHYGHETEVYESECTIFKLQAEAQLLNECDLCKGVKSTQLRVIY